MPPISFIELLMQERRAVSVSELTAQIKILVEGQFLDVWVEGEVSNFRRHTSGHWYFSLKDEGAMLRCASFRTQNRLIRFAPEDGLTVKARGRLSLYETRGEYQLLVDHLEPVGIGSLQLAFEQLKSRLAVEGLFDLERKRPLPLLPRRIGVVTSPTGAAIRDIIRVIQRRNEGMGVLIAPARVQGDGAGEEIAAAMEALNSVADVDVIIVARGGGSMEDLWCFNEECVARAIFHSRAPVISAVGHETDFTLSDFVADLRASTPSAAAEIVTMARDQMAERISALREDLASALRYRLLEFRNTVSQLASARAFYDVPMRINAAAQGLDSALAALETASGGMLRRARSAYEQVSLRLRDSDIKIATVERRGRIAILETRMLSAARAITDRDAERLAVAAGKLDSLSPLSVLGRGYAIAFGDGGRIIKRAADVKPGASVRVRLGEGELNCEVRGRNEP